MNALHAWLIPALWGVWTLYWIAAAADTKTTRQQESGLSRASHIIPLLVGVALFWGVAPARIGWLSGYFLPPTEVSFWSGAAITVAGLGFSIWARRHLGRNWSGVVTLKEDHELIRSGPYRFVRHPIYTGLLLAGLGTAFAFGEWRNLLGLAFVAGAFVRKIGIEERGMIIVFQERYTRYSAEVSALIPFIY